MRKYKGYEITRGDYVGTTDNRIDRWYIDHSDGPVDRRGAGYRTQQEAMEALDQMLQYA